VGVFSEHHVIAVLFKNNWFN